jgi:hypothetical protein
MKICNKCKELKFIDDFYKKTSSKDGLCSICKSCVQQHNKKYYSDNIEKNKINCQEYRVNNRSKLIAYYKKWKSENNEIRKKCNKEWAEKNIDKDRQSKSAYKKRNPANNCASAAKRRASKINATPNWLSDIQIMQINWFYSAARMMSETSNIKHHVDHIHPINGADFNGLHVPWNLRVIKSHENESKGNRPPCSEKSLFWRLA